MRPVQIKINVSIASLMIVSEIPNCELEFQKYLRSCAFVKLTSNFIAPVGADDKNSLEKSRCLVSVYQTSVG